MTDDYDTTAEQTYWLVLVDKRTGNTSTRGPMTAVEANQGIRLLQVPGLVCIAVEYAR